MIKMGNLEKGRAGEDAARKCLEKKGLRFLAANYRTRAGEIDLIMGQGDAIVFVEVKQRLTSKFGRPQEAVTIWKQRKMAKAALMYVKETGSWRKALRFDVVAIGPEGAEHLENAFEIEGGKYTL